MKNKISIVIPFHKDVKLLEKCLSGISNSSFNEYEIIVVNDTSKDLSHLKNEFDFKELSIPETNVSKARNKGVKEAENDIILFIDEDVVVKEHTIKKIYESFENEDIDGLQPTYTTESYYKNFASRFKNYYLHFRFWLNPSEFISSSDTFCFAVKKDAFESVSGFDEDFFASYTCEDEDLGHRLNDNGYKIKLDENIQAMHVKKETVFSLLEMEFGTGRSMSHQFLTKKLSSDSNRTMQISQNDIGTMLPILASIFFIYGFFLSLILNRLYLSAFSFLAFSVLNYKFLYFLSRFEKISFLIFSIFMHFSGLFFASLGSLFGISDFLKS